MSSDLYASVLFTSLEPLTSITPDAHEGNHGEKQNQQEDCAAGPGCYKPHFFILSAVCHDECILQGENRNEGVDHVDRSQLGNQRVFHPPRTFKMADTDSNSICCIGRHRNGGDHTEGILPLAPDHGCN